jgi:hypothetical protein
VKIYNVHESKNRIALISVSGDPAAEIGQEEAGGKMFMCVKLD